MRRRFIPTQPTKFAVGAEPKQRIAVEKMVAFARGIFVAAPSIATLAIFVQAQQDFSDEIDDRLTTQTGALSEEFLGQVRLDIDRWMIRLSHYAAWIEMALSGLSTVWVTEQGVVVDEGSPDAALEMDMPDFLDLYLVRPLLYGKAYTIPQAEYEGQQDPEGYAAFPDIGTGFSLVNQLNAVGNIFDDASLLEKRFGIWLEIAAQVKQSEWGQDYADEIDTVIRQTEKALQATSDFIEEAAKKGASILIGLVLVGVVAYGISKGRA